MTFGAIVLAFDVVAFLWLLHYLVKSVVKSRAEKPKGPSAEDAEP